MKKITVGMMMLIAVLSACKKDKTDPDNATGGNATVTASNYGFDNGSSGKFSSTTAGIAQTNLPAVAGIDPSTFSITAIKDGTKESLSIIVFKKVTATGVIKFGAKLNGNGGATLTKDYTKPSDKELNYSTDNATGGGELNITKIDGKNVEGTFYFVAFNSTGKQAFAEQGTFKGVIN